TRPADTRFDNVGDHRRSEPRRRARSAGGSCYIAHHLSRNHRHHRPPAALAVETRDVEAKAYGQRARTRRPPSAGPAPRRKPRDPAWPVGAKGPIRAAKGALQGGLLVDDDKRVASEPEQRRIK